MIKYIINDTSGKLTEADTIQNNCWIHMESPTDEEIYNIFEKTGLPEHFIKTALDEEEAAHLDYEGDSRLVVIDIPKMTDDLEIFTIPLSIIQNENYFVTVCTMHTSVLDDFFAGKIKNVEVNRRNKLIYQIMFNTFSRFLYYLKQIDKTSNLISKTLSKSMQNKELLQLLELQKALVFFSSSLTADYAVVQKTVNCYKSKCEEDERDILEDVVIECKQAIEMCSVYREIIKNSMDAFASVVNNNQNIVMKFLTAVTIILSIPMVISGFWGMNTPVPMQNGTVGAFWILVGISLVISTVTAIIMAKRRMF